MYNKPRFRSFLLALGLLVATVTSSQVRAQPRSEPGSEQYQAEYEAMTPVVEKALAGYNAKNMNQYYENFSERSFKGESDWNQMVMNQMYRKLGPFKSLTFEREILYRDGRNGNLYYSAVFAKKSTRVKVQITRDGGNKLRILGLTTVDERQY